MTAATSPDAIESLLIQGDLARLTPEERSRYYLRVCQSLGLNPLTRPLEYMTLNNRLTLYARKDATDQLRKLHGVSIGEPTIRFEDEWIIVTVSARLPDGRTDSDIGVVNRRDMRGDFGNCLMKAVTKAKRRATLSICGLGLLDETELADIPTARPLADSAAPALAAPEEDRDAEERAAIAQEGSERTMGNPVQDLAALRALLTRKGKGSTEGYQQCLSRLNAQFGSTHTAREAWLSIPQERRAWLVAQVESLPDVGG